MKGTNLHLVALVACVACAAVVPAAGRGLAPRRSDRRLARSIDAVLSSIYAPDGPGATAIVVKDGRVVLRKAYGLANVELGVPMRPEMVMALGSLTKSFTAAAILKLAEQGRLSLGDPVTRFLPDFPAHGATITVEHLLTHTSGINVLADMPDLRAVAAQDGKVTDVIGDWVKDLPPDAAPGERWAYLNWGYSLLGAIVERASGLGYAEFLQRAFFDPLELRHTAYGDRRRLISLRASGYEGLGDGVFNVLPSRGRIFHPAAAGGLLSNVDDLARWSAALDDGTALGRASVDRMFTPFRLADGTSTRYGYGWDLGEYEGHRVQEHAGGTAGFQSFVVRAPDDHVFVAILSNTQSGDAPLQATAHRVAAIAMGRPIADPVPRPVPPDALDRMAGVYRGHELGTFTVSRRGDGLVAQVGGLAELLLVPVAPSTFRSTRVTWTFAFGEGPGGQAAGVRVTDWKLDDLAVRVVLAPDVAPAFVQLDRADLQACVGEYESLDGVLVKVGRVDDHLVAQAAAQPPADLYPASINEFYTRDGGGRFTFVRGSRGVVTLLLRSTGGGRPVPARRIGSEACG